MKKHYYIFLVLVSLFSSCNTDKISLPTLLITPSELEQIVSPNETISFSINIEAEAKINKLEITESINGTTNILIYDTSFSEVNNADVVFLYKMPNSRENTTITLSFKVYDKDNNIGTGARKLTISPSDSLLSEKVNLILYSGNSKKRNAFLIDNDSLVYADSVFIDDIDILTSDTSDVLDLSWSSPKGNKFVVFNSFNYDSASFKSVTEAYQFGNEQSRVSNLSIGDIIIAKLRSSTEYEYALMKLTNVVDDTGSTLDKYVFNIKK